MSRPRSSVRIVPRETGSASAPSRAAGETRQSAVGGGESVGGLGSDRGFAEQATIQHRVVPGELQEADLEESQDRLRGGALLEQTEKIVQELEHRLVLLVFGRNWSVRSIR